MIRMDILGTIHILEYSGLLFFWNVILCFILAQSLKTVLQKLEFDLFL